MAREKLSQKPQLNFPSQFLVDVCELPNDDFKCLLSLVLLLGGDILSYDLFELQLTASTGPP